PKIQWEGWEPIDEAGKVRKMRLIELTYAPGDDQRLFAVTQHGTIYVFDNRADVEQAHLFLDLEKKVSQWPDRGANEQGLLGLALHPKFQENGEFFVSYTQREDHR